MTPILAPRRVEKKGTHKSIEKKDSQAFQRVSGKSTTPKIERGASLGMPRFLQRSAGQSYSNHQIGKTLQAKLTVGAPGDQYEQEADLVATQVVDQIHSPQTQQKTVQRQEMPEEEDKIAMKPLANSIQRQDISANEEEDQLAMKPLSTAIQRQEISEDEYDQLNMKPLSNSIQRQEISEEEDEDQIAMKPLSGSIQRQEISEAEDDEQLNMKPLIQHEADGGGLASANLTSSIEGARGKGQALTDPVRAPMEQAFGADFSGVNIHADSDPKADQLNQSLGARAFTSGQDIFFRQGEYQPGNRGGQELLAHELTHVVQQTGNITASVQRLESPEHTGGPEEDQGTTGSPDWEAYEDAYDYCAAQVDLDYGDPQEYEYPKIVDSDGSRNRISPMPRSLYPEEKRVLRQFYGNSFDVDSIKIDTSINNTRHQVAGEKQIRMRSEDFHQYTVKNLMDIDCGFQFYEETWLGELRLGTTDVKAGLIHEGFHIYQRSKGLNVTSEWLQSRIFKFLAEEVTDLRFDLYDYGDISKMDKKQLFDLYQRLGFEAQSELYENFFRLLAGDSSVNKESKVNIDSYELVVREVIGDHSNSWQDILQSMRK